MARYIISDYVNGRPVKSVHQNMTLEQKLHAMSKFYFPVMGVYKNSEEKSYIIYDLSEEQALGLVRAFNQECAAVLSKYRAFGLLWAEGNYESLGQWTTSTEKPDCDSYTYNPANGLYLFVK